MFMQCAHSQQLAAQFRSVFTRYVESSEQQQGLATCVVVLARRSQIVH